MLRRFEPSRSHHAVRPGGLGFIYWNAKSMDFTFLGGRTRPFTITAPTRRPDLGAAIRTAIRSNAHTFLNPPIANLGHRGIAKAAHQVRRWLDRGCDLALVATLMERGGTGGGPFRVMYSDFLAEAATITDDDIICRGHQMYAETARRGPRSRTAHGRGEIHDPDNLGPGLGRSRRPVPPGAARDADAGRPAGLRARAVSSPANGGFRHPRPGRCPRAAHLGRSAAWR